MITQVTINGPKELASADSMAAKNGSKEKKTKDDQYSSPNLDNSDEKDSLNGANVAVFDDSE